MVHWVFRGSAGAFGLVALVAGVLWTLTLPPPRPGQLAGYQTLTITPSQRDEAVALHLWYPAEQDGLPRVIGQNANFKGAWAGEGAAPLPGPHPLILIAQEAGWRAEGLSWLAARLATAGFAVAIPASPGLASGDAELDARLRAGDLSASLDRLTTDPPTGLTLDTGRLDAVGIGIGGTAVLTLAGARLSEGETALICASNLTAALHRSDCQGFVVDGSDLLPPDEANTTVDRADPRLRRFILANPTLIAALDRGSLRDIKGRVMVLDLPDVSDPSWGGRGSAALRGLAEQIPRSGYDFLPHLDANSFRPECTRLAQIVTGFLPMNRMCRDRLFGLRQADVGGSSLMMQIESIFRQQDQDLDQTFRESHARAGKATGGLRFAP